MTSEKASILTLAGESGSGKTTLARMMLGLIQPTSGEILYKGKDVTRIHQHRDRLWFRKEVQPIFQNPFETFNPLRRIERYLYETAQNYKLAGSASEAEPIIEEALRSVGMSLDQVRKRYPNELSGGQLQRTSVARALITKPSLLIADEPVSMVDASLRMSIVNLFKELCQNLNVSVVYVTHDLATAYYIGDRIAIMLRGVIVEMGSVDNVLMKPLHPYTQLLKKSVPEPDPEQQWDEEIKLSTFETEEYARKGCKFAGRCPQVMPICKTSPPEDTVVDSTTVKCFLYTNQ
jgi:peptide/nickel transport system ATP-binding protein